MEIFYIISISLLGFFLLYLLVKSKITDIIENKLKLLYKDKISADIQDFYSELESYSAIIDSRIGRLKTLTERHEANLKTWENIQIEIKKSKSGKELLSYLDENQKSLKPDDDLIKNLKNEITADLKKYLAAKLNLTTDSENIKSDSLKNKIPVNTKTPFDKDKNAAPLKNENIDNEYNVAELILDDIDAREARKDSQLKRTAVKEDSPVMTKAIPDIRQQTENQNTDNDSTFLNILGAVGRALTPLFMKSESPAKNLTTSSVPENKTLNNRNFNDLLKKEIKTSDAILQTRKKASDDSFLKNAQIGDAKFSTIETPPEIPAQKFTKSMEPAELMKLIEDLKISRLRPDALKNLLSHGFKMEQIAELSNVPFSDLELTRNLYHI